MYQKEGEGTGRGEGREGKTTFKLLVTVPFLPLGLLWFSDVAYPNLGYR